MKTIILKNKKDNSTLQGFLIVQEDNKLGLINDFEEKILLAVYDDISYYGGSNLICKIGNRCRIFNFADRNFLLEIECEDLVPLAEDLYVKVERDKYASGVDAKTAFDKIMTVEYFKQVIGVSELNLIADETVGKDGLIKDEKGHVVGIVSKKIRSKKDIINPMIGVLKETGVACMFNDMKLYDIVNTEGNILTHFSLSLDELSYTSSSSFPVYFSHSRILCSNDKYKYGFIDLEKSIVSISFRYSNILRRDAFLGNTILRRDELYCDICINEKWGVLEIKSGKEILSCKYDDRIPNVLPYSYHSNSFKSINGKKICIVKQDGYYGCIDENYYEIIPCVYNHVEFDMNLQGIYCCLGGYQDYDFGWNHISAGSWGCFDNNGDCIVPIEYDKIEIINGYISAGKGACEEKPNGYYVWTLYSMEGKIILKDYNEISIQNNFIILRKAVYRKSTRDNESGYDYYEVLGGYYNLYDMKGNLLLDKNFSNIYIIDDTLVHVTIENLSGIVNVYSPNWNNVVYDCIHLYNSKGKFYLVKKNGKYGLINHQGEAILKPLYDNISEFKEEKAYISIEGKVGVINYEEEILVKPEYLYMKDSINEYAEVCKYNDELNMEVFGVINIESGCPLLACEYGYVEIISSIKKDNQDVFLKELLIQVKKDNWYGLLDFSGKIIVPIKYQKITDKASYEKYFQDYECYKDYPGNDEEKITNVYFTDDLIVESAFENMYKHICRPSLVHDKEYYYRRKWFNKEIQKQYNLPAQTNYNYEEHEDWRADTWDALTDGQYGDYTDGDIDYDIFGF